MACKEGGLGRSLAFGRRLIVIPLPFSCLFQLCLKARTWAQGHHLGFGTKGSHEDKAGEHSEGEGN